jgi:transaldolase
VTRPCIDPAPTSRNDLRVPPEATSPNPAALAAIAAAALEMVEDGARLGLGTGRAAATFIDLLGRRVREGLRVTGVPTSEASARQARELGIPLIELDEDTELDCTFDGADEVSPDLDLVKGWGGALVRERIVAAASKRQVILVGDEKLVRGLGQRGRIPVEVIPLGRGPVLRRLRALDLVPTVRPKPGGTEPYVTDNGNLTIDVTPRAPLADGAAARALDAARHPGGRRHGPLPRHGRARARRLPRRPRGDAAPPRRRKEQWMNPTRRLHDVGQSIWLDNITRDLLNGGGLKKYIDELSVTGLTSNPTIFDLAIKGSADYDEAIKAGAAKGREGEALFFDLALDDLTRAADLFRPIWERTKGVDGWVSLEVSPKLAYDTQSTVAAARDLHARAGRPNLFIKIPGTPEGLPAIEESIFAGVPVNVTLLFSREHYLAAAYAYIRGIERRIAKGLDPDVASVASVFVSRWDVAASKTLPDEKKDKLGVAMGKRVYKSYRDLLNSDRWLRLANAGARPQRLLFASTGTKDPKASDILYVAGLAAPNTVDTMPEKTLLAFADHGELRGTIPADGGDAEDVLDDIARSGIDLEALAAQLQKDGAEAFVKSWEDLLGVLVEKSKSLKRAG